MDQSLYYGVVIGCGTVLIATLMIYRSFRQKGPLASLLTQYLKNPSQLGPLAALCVLFFLGQMFCRVRVVALEDTVLCAGIREATIHNQGTVPLGVKPFERRVSFQSAGRVYQGSLLILTRPIDYLYEISCAELSSEPVRTKSAFVPVGMVGAVHVVRSKIRLEHSLLISWLRFVTGVVCYIVAIYLLVKTLTSRSPIQDEGVIPDLAVEGDKV